MIGAERIMVEPCARCVFRRRLGNSPLGYEIDKYMKQSGSWQSIAQGFTSNTERLAIVALSSRRLISRIDLGLSSKDATPEEVAEAMQGCLMPAIGERPKKCLAVQMLLERKNLSKQPVAEIEERKTRHDEAVQKAASRMSRKIIDRTIEI